MTIIDSPRSQSSLLPFCAAAGLAFAPPRVTMQTLHNHGPTRRQPSNSVHEQQQDDVYSDDYREYQSDQQQAYQQDQQDQQDHQHQSTGPSQRHCRIHHPRSGGSPESGIRIDQRTRSVSSNLWRTVHASIMPRRATWLSNFGSKSHPHERRRVSTFTLASGSRKKERRWPLVLRFWKGSVHVGEYAEMTERDIADGSRADIMFPILCLSLFSAAVVWAEKHISTSFYLPSSIVSLGEEMHTRQLVF